MPCTVTVNLHHEVLPVWAECAEKNGVAPEVLTLDFHTDVLCSCRRGVSPETGRSVGCAAAAVAQLHHDEHFDWALRSGIISRAVIISLSGCAVMPEHPALEVRHSEILPPVGVMLNEPEKFRDTASSVLDDSFLGPLLADKYPHGKYILDIDCDYILCRSALCPKKHRVIDDLAEYAQLITFSCENDWVRILKLPGESISGTSIAHELRTRWEK